MQIFSCENFHYIRIHLQIQEEKEELLFVNIIALFQEEETKCKKAGPADGSGVSVWARVRHGTALYGIHASTSKDALVGNSFP